MAAFTRGAAASTGAAAAPAGKASSFAKAATAHVESYRGGNGAGAAPAPTFYVGAWVYAEFETGYSELHRGIVDFLGIDRLFSGWTASESDPNK